jgi:hypothetical protein
MKITKKPQNHNSKFLSHKKWHKMDTVAKNLEHIMTSINRQ